MQSIVVVTIRFAMSAAVSGPSGPTFLPGWNSILSGIGGDDDIASIAGEKRPVTDQALLPAAGDFNATPLDIVAKNLGWMMFMHRV